MTKDSFRIRLKNGRFPLKTVAVFSILVCGLFFVSSFAHAETFKYELLESFPGFFAKGESPTLPDLISAIYKFGIWTVGIAAMFMITIGGIMYVTSAGNTSKAGSAKSVITDALIGILVALGAYLFLYVINPDLTRMDFDLIRVNMENMPLSEGGGGGNCEPVPNESSPGSVKNLASAFGANAVKASSICKIESGGKVGASSNTDLCKDGASFSIGLFQINITAHADKLGCAPADQIFYLNPISGHTEGKCLTKKNGGCIRDCSIKSRPLYDACVALAKNPQKNIAVAKSLSKGGSDWRQWGANSICKF